MKEEKLSIWTIGHSTRTEAEFRSLLTINSIEALADVRRFRASRKYPQFNEDELSKTLADAAIEYAAFPELGGRRPPRPDSPNTIWRNESFRGYADHMETEEFHSGIQRLVKLANSKRTAVMCAEAVWWRCHRALIADYLKSKDIPVFHIIDAKAPKLHPYTSAARLIEGNLSYSPAAA